METAIITSISVICTIIGALLGIATYKRNHEKEIKSEVKVDTQEKIQMNAKLDAILSNNAKMESSVKELSDKFDSFKDDFGTRLAKVEERCELLYKMIGKKK